MLRTLQGCLPELGVADRRLLIARAGTSDRDAHSLTALARQLHVSRGAVRVRVVRAAQRLRRLGGSSACAGSSSGAFGAGGTAGPATGVGGAGLLADLSGSTSLLRKASEGRLVTAGWDPGAATGNPEHSPMSRLFHAAKSGTTDPLLLLVVIFFVTWGALAGLAALVSHRRRTNNTTGSL